MSLKDRWYMWRDANGKRLEHNPRGCYCFECKLYRKLSSISLGAGTQKILRGV